MSIMRTAPTGERHVEQEARLDGSDLTTGALDRMVRGGGLRTRWRRRLQPFLLASDVGVITLGLVAFSIGSFPETLAVYVGALLTLSALGAYRSRLTLSVLDDVPALVSAALVGAVAELVLRTAGRQRQAAPSRRCCVTRWPSRCCSWSPAPSPTSWCARRAAAA